MGRNRTVGVVVSIALALSAAGCASGAGETGSDPASTTAPGGAAETTAATPSETATDNALAGLLPPAPDDVTIPAPSLAGNLVEEPAEQHIQVSVPPDYATSDKRYPVVYYLPGFGDSYRMFAAGASETMILVGVNGINRTGGSFYYNSPVTGNWEDFVTQDVVGYVDANYRTVAEPAGRALVGHSMGGFGVLNAVMHTDVFAYAYSMSPGVFAEGGLSQFALDFGVLATFVQSVKDLDDDAARQAYLDRIGTTSWPTNLSFSYAAVFAPDADGRAPYVQLPKKDADGEYAHDAVWDKYDGGYGNIPAKLDEYGDNLAKLKGFVVEYGTKDEFRFIPEGCDYLSAQLKERGIAHELVTYEGTHQGQLRSRLDTVVLPYLEGKFAA